MVLPLAAKEQIRRMAESANEREMNNRTAKALRKLSLSKAEYKLAKKVLKDVQRGNNSVSLGGAENTGNSITHNDKTQGR
jgi:hypothetical protein